MFDLTKRGHTGRWWRSLKWIARHSTSSRIRESVLSLMSLAHTGRQSIDPDWASAGLHSLNTPIAKLAKLS